MQSIDVACTAQVVNEYILEGICNLLALPGINIAVLIYCTLEGYTIMISSADSGRRRFTHGTVNCSLINDQ